MSNHQPNWSIQAYFGIRSSNYRCNLASRCELSNRVIAGVRDIEVAFFVFGYAARCVEQCRSSLTIRIARRTAARQRRNITVN